MSQTPQLTSATPASAALSALFSLLALVLFAACGSDIETQRTCVPGDEDVCACGGRAGTHVCRDDRTWGTCSCDVGDASIDSEGDGGQSDLDAVQDIADDVDVADDVGDLTDVQDDQAEDGPDAPVPPLEVVANEGLSVDEGDEDVPVTADELEVGPPESTSEDISTDITITLVTAPGEGRLYLDDDALAADDTFTQAHIDDGQLTYSHDGSETTADVFEFSATADGYGPLATQSFSVSVAPVNDPPSLSTLPPDSATEDIEYSYSAAADDPDGPSTIWATRGNDTCGGVIGSSTGEYTFTPAGPTPPARCDLSIEVCDGDATNNECAQQFTSVTISPVNNTPAITTTGPTAATEDVRYAYNADANDPDGPGENWRVTEADTCGGAIEATGVYSFTPAGPVPAGSCTAAIEVCDGGTPDECDTEIIQISAITAVNDAPVVTTTPSTGATQDLEYAYEPDHIDLDGPGEAWQLGENDDCTGSSIDEEAGRYTFTPGAESQECELHIRVCDEHPTEELCADQQVTLSITIPSAPEINTEAPDVATEDVEYSYQPEFVDPDGPGARWTRLEDDTCGDESTVDLNTETGLYTFTAAGPVPSDDCVLSIELCDEGEPERCDSETVTIDITAVNDDPAITTSAGDSATEDELYTYEAAFADPDGPGATWSVADNDTCGGAFDGEAGVYTFTPGGPVPADDCLLSIEMCDGGIPERCDVEAQLITISPENDSPVVTSTAPSGATEEAEYVYDAEVLDPDGPEVHWGVLDETDTCSGQIVEATGVYTFTPTRPAPPTCDVSIQVCDGATEPECGEQTVTVTITDLKVPEITTSAPTPAIEDTEYSYAPEFTDPDGPGAAWEILGADTCGGEIVEETGVYTFTPGGPVPAVSCTLSIQVCDGGEPNLCDSETAAIEITAVNDDPVITTEAASEATENEEYRYDADRDDLDGPGLIWTLAESDNCPGSAIDAGTGVYTFTPDDSPPDTCVLHISACDQHESDEKCDTELVTIDITSINDEPEITSSPLGTAAENVQYVYNPVLDDPDGPGAFWTVGAGDDCPGADIDSGTGAYAFTPGDDPPASCSLHIMVCDMHLIEDLCDQQAVTISIAAENDPPDILTTAPLEAAENAGYSYGPGLADPDGPGEIWTLGGNNDCPGSSVVAETGVYAFTPDDDPPAECELHIRVCDQHPTDEHCDEEQATVVITAFNDPPAITTDAPTDATEDAEYSYDADVEDPDGPEANWSVDDGDSCGGEIDQDGVYTFTPAGESMPIACILSIEVCDGDPDDEQCVTEDEGININARPTMAAIDDVVSQLNASISAIAVTVGDRETAAGALVVEATSSNLQLLPDENLAVGGADGNRTLTITPIADQAGSATITVTVTDEGDAVRTTEFLLTVVACGAGESSFASSRPLGLYEPCAEMSPAWPDACDSVVMANPGGASSWQRTNEPVEIPLVNGVLDENVVGLWRLDDDVIDSGPFDRAGTLSGGSYPTGIYGSGLKLDGTDDFMSVTGDFLAEASAYSVAFWIKTFSGDAAILSNGDDSEDGASGWSIELTGGGLVSPYHLGRLPDDGGVVLSSPVNDGEWHHVVVTRSAQGWVSYFVDGALDAAGPEDEQPPAVSVLEIGRRSAGDERYLDGTLDEVVFFSRALSPADVAVYYSSGEPYATPLVDAAQVDFDDLRVTENGERVTHDLVGARPHSDTDLSRVLGYWRLDGDAIDETGASTGSNSGGEPGRGRFGDVDGAMAIQSGDYIDTGFSRTFEESESFTIEGWVRVTHQRNNQQLVGMEVDSANRLNLGFGETEAWFEFRDDNNALQRVSGPAQLRDGRWHHLAGVRDAQAGAIHVYVDGLLINTSAGSGARINPGGYALFIGARNRDGSANDHIDGLVDEVLIHDVAKSADTIYNRANPGVPTVRFLASTDAVANGSGHYDYNDYALHWGNPDAEYLAPLVPNPGAGAPCEGLLSECNGYVGWWRFDEAGGTTAIDATGGRRHGSLSDSGGAAVWTTGLHGTAIDFSGSGAVVTVDPFPSWSVGDELTIEAWVTHAGTVGSYDTIVANSTAQGSFPQFQFMFDGSDVLRLYSLDPTEVIQSTYAGSPACATSGEWCGLAFTHTLGSGPAAILENGSAISGSWLEGGPENAPHPSAALTIGDRADGTGAYEGAIDSIRIMSRALPPDELLHYPLSGTSAGTAATAPYSCVSNPDPLGSACVDDLDCASANCSSETCAPGGFARIPAGAFWMGSPDGCPGPDGYPGDCTAELGRDPDEALHRVTLTRPFWIQQSEVTQSQWRDVTGDNPASFDGCGDECPVEQVSWWDALSYANALSRSAGLTECYDLGACTGSPGVDFSCTDVVLADSVEGSAYDCEGYRLPTEAEWEAAGRGGSVMAYHTGAAQAPGRDPLDPNLDSAGWYGGNSTAHYEGAEDCTGYFPGSDNCGPQIVGTKAANALGVFDMSGNVYEWTWDDLGTYAGDTTDPIGDTDDSARIVRGGSWEGTAAEARLANRGNLPPEARVNRFGFRLVRTVPAASDDTCLDGYFNGDEVDVDCGGSCAACALGSACVENGDCADGFCAIGTCSAGEEGDPCEDATDCSGGAAVCSTAGQCQDGSDGDACSDATDCGEALSCFTDGCGACPAAETFGSSRSLDLYEPCAEMSPAWPGSCDSASMANPGGASSWQRTDEPVEIPLVNGYLDSSVVGYWPLDGDATDDTRWSNDGTLVGGAVATADRHGNSSGAILFDGLDDEIVIPYGSQLEPGDAVTVSAWVSVGSAPSEPLAMIVSARYADASCPNGDSDDPYALYIDQSRELTWEVENSTAGGSVVEVVGPVLEIDTWYHAVGVFDADRPNGNAQLYVDGVLVGSADSGVALDSLCEHNLRLGSQRDFGDDDKRWFAGSIDDVLLFNRALTSTEVSAYHDSDAPYATSDVPDAQPDFDDIRVTENGERVTHEVIGVRPHSDTDLEHIVAYWPLDGSAADLAGTATATIVGATLGLGRFGDANGAMAFDGAADYIDSGFTREFGSTDSFTIEAWVRVTSPGGNQQVVGMEVDANNEINLGVSPTLAWFSLRDEYGASWNAAGDADLGDGEWHHLAGVRDAGAHEVTLYVDGLQIDSSPDIGTGRINAGENALFIGARNGGGSANDHLGGLVDEVIIHGVAKSADYIYNRAIPGVPTVRFLASAEAVANTGGHYDYNDYGLHWGNADAEYVAPRVADPDGGASCQGLLSPCNGYVGWWRFGERNGTVADQSINRLHAQILGSPQITSGPGAPALSFDGVAAYGRVPVAPELRLTRFTVEVVANVHVATRWRALVSRGWGSDPNVFNYQLALDDSRHATLLWEEGASGNYGATDSSPLSLGAWHGVAGSYDGSTATVLVDFETVATAPESTDPVPDAPGDFVIAATENDTGTGVYRWLDAEFATARTMNRALDPDELLHFPLSGRATGTVTTAIAACVSDPRPLGAACETDFDCASLHCNGGQCGCLGSWAVVDESTPRQLPSTGAHGLAVMADRRVWQLGGYDPTAGTTHFFDAWTYHLGTGEWTDETTSGGPGSTSTGRMAPDTLNNRLYLWNFGTAGSGPTDDLYVLDPSDGSLTKRQDGPNRYGTFHTYGSHQDRFFTFGGVWYDGGEYNDLYEYSYDDNEWTEITLSGDIPSGRHNGGMAADPASTDLYVFSGYNRDSEEVFSDMYRIDTATGVSTLVTPAGELPVGVNYSDGVWIEADSRIAFIGNRFGEDSLGWALYDVTDNRWLGSGEVTGVNARGNTPNGDYDPVTEAYLLFGGYSSVDGIETTYDTLRALTFDCAVAE